MVLDRVYRDDRARLLARLISIVRDFDLAEDALQDAFVAASTTWCESGIPANPAGWLITTARRKAIDRLRRASAAQRRQRAWGELAIAWNSGESSSQPIEDDRLRLIFTCCHPALQIESRVALTLRALGGLTTREVAVAFLVSEQTLAQRIVRAKRKIRETRIAYRVPANNEFTERLGGVLAVIYLIFNAGYLAASGEELLRGELCQEAIDLASLLIELLPNEPESLGLAALLHLQHSRRDARIGLDGAVLTLEEQDRNRWDVSSVATGMALLARANSFGQIGPYQIKAKLSAIHATTEDADNTDWHVIVDLYDQLLLFEPTAVVRLNRAVAVAMAEGALAGLALLDEPELADELAEYHLFHLTRADLLRRAGQFRAAADAYRLARDQTENEAERAFLDRRTNEVTASLDDSVTDSGSRAEFA